jgi:hypothetical protein
LGDVVAMLGRIGADLDLEFLQRVYRRLEKVGAIVRVGVLDAVDRVVIELEPLA